MDFIEKLMDGAVYVILITACLVLPICGGCGTYLEGKAHQRILKERHGIEMPWYEAAFIDVGTEDINARLSDD